MARDLKNPLAGSDFDKEKKDKTTKKKVRRTTTDTSGSYPYNTASRKTIVKKADKKGYIKKKKEKFTEGKKDEKPSYTRKTKTTYVKGKAKLLNRKGKNKKSIGEKGNVSKVKTKSDIYGKSKKYTKTDSRGARLLETEITKKEYNRRKRK